MGDSRRWKRPSRPLCAHVTSDRHDLGAHRLEEVCAPAVGGMDDMWGVHFSLGRRHGVISGGRRGT